MTSDRPVRTWTHIASVLPLLALLGIVGWTVLLAATAGPVVAMAAVGGTCVMAFRRAVEVAHSRPSRPAAEIDDDELIVRIVEEASAWPLS